ncbi:site-specific DNA-methyltransferase [Pseudomonas aeruginosa]|uniref:site-specific DNA-methyltransferase n=1 Tax=Pseudomonas aeruginosa TaxID=287 RepID=UPI0005BD8AAE|nr:DNA methyltransferase [Pseudomonas aeruginosa]EIU3493043.1 site-specific DNA-methyltransferase [Pseudomonas aeruginosa]MBK1801485.1 site-specific DNA-methyltransferase [Pseudomonas aeruginosa]
MSRLTDLIAKAKAKDSALGAELDREFKMLSSRLPFGLNFERHSPEAVELPLRPLRKGDKVRVLPERGETRKGDQRLWQVKAIHKAKKMADLELLGAAEIETQTVAVDDLVVVAEFRDTIYPGLVSTGKVQRGGDKPCHTVINGENYHVLKALTYTHRGKVDAIYIDPPYNTGAKDWKYNNDYVEGDDQYRHSKWLAMMERRLQVAKELLNPADSVLIVTIDEKEYLRLGLLLEQLFPEAQIEMVTTVISAKGVARFGQFSRVEEFIFFARLGKSTVQLGEQNMLDESRSATAQIGKDIDWLGLRRREPTAKRGARPNQFYPIFVDAKTGYIESIGEPITDDVDRLTVKVPKGTFAVWPLRPNGGEGLWGITPETAKCYLKDGYIRARNYKPELEQVSIHYLPSGTVSAIQDGRIDVVGRDPDGAVQAVHRERKGVIPKRVWNMTSHNAENGGSLILSKLLLGRRFPFPKSLYAVEDSLRFFIGDKPEAVILDFFSGSGTTAHAVMRLNRQDGGHRQCISVTNNEVAADEQKKLREAGLRPGDAEWEKNGICDYITKPRVATAITGKTPDGEPIKGDYKFTDEFPMADGFEENAEFFTLTYETPVSVNYNLAFNRIAPLLWLRAGARGGRIDRLPSDGWAVADAYGLLNQVDAATPFIKALAEADGIRIAYIVTDDDRRFQAIAKRLPDGVEPVRLYESYLTNFSFTNGE